MASSKDTWGAELAANRERYEVVARQIAACDPEDLATWGHPLDTFWKPMEDADPEAWKPRALAFDNFQAQRRGLRWARKLVQQSSTVNGWLGSTRRVTDVLLRDGFSVYAEPGDGRPKADAEERDE